MSGGNASNTKGDRVERELIHALDGSGFAAMRCPSSGSATDRDLPDVLAGRRVDADESRRSDAYAFEVKASSGDPIYLDGDEVVDLAAFARRFGAAPRLAVKFDVKRGDPAWGVADRSGIYAIHPEDCWETDGGNYRVKRRAAIDDGTPVESL